MCASAGLVGMADRNRQGISGIRIGRDGTRQQQLDHMVNLLLGRVADADHRLFDHVGGILKYRKPRLCRHQHRDAARLPQLQRTHRVFVDKGLLHRHFLRREQLRWCLCPRGPGNC